MGSKSTKDNIKIENMRFKGVINTVRSVCHEMVRPLSI